MAPQQIHIAAGRYSIAIQEEAKVRQGGSGRFGSSSKEEKPPSSPGTSTHKAAEKFRIGHATVSKAVSVIRHSPELAAAVEKGKIALTAAAVTVARERAESKSSISQRAAATGPARADHEPLCR